MGEMVSETGGKRRTAQKGADTRDTGRVDFKGYVSPTLDQAAKRAYKQWDLDYSLLNVAMENLPKEGYKISVDYMARERAYRASIYCQMAGHKHAGYCLTLWAGGAWEALHRVVYCHQEILRGDWSTLLTDRSWKDDWS